MQKRNDIASDVKYSVQNAALNCTCGALGVIGDSVCVGGDDVINSRM